MFLWLLLSLSYGCSCYCCSWFFCCTVSISPPVSVQVPVCDSVTVSIPSSVPDPVLFAVPLAEPVIILCCLLNLVMFSFLF